MHAYNVPCKLKVLDHMSTLCCMSLALFSEVAGAAYILVIADCRLQQLNLCTVLSCISTLTAAGTLLQGRSDAETMLC